MRVIIWSSLHVVWKFSVEHRYIFNSWAQCPANGNSLSSWHYLLVTFWCSICGFRVEVLVGLYKAQVLKGLGEFSAYLGPSLRWRVCGLWSAVLQLSLWLSCLVFHTKSWKENPLPTYRTLYQEFITATTVTELGFSFVKYVASIIHFEVLCVHLWFPVDRLYLVFLFSKLGSAAQEYGQFTTSAWKSKFSY